MTSFIKCTIENWTKLEVAPPPTHTHTHTHTPWRQLFIQSKAYKKYSKWQENNISVENLGFLTVLTKTIENGF